MGKKWKKKLKKMGIDLDELSKKVTSAAEDVKAAWELGEEEIQKKASDFKGDVSALEEKARIAEEEHKSKISSSLLQAQMTFRAKLEDLKDAKDKKKLENYIESQIDFIMDSYDAASLLVAGAQLAILETLAAADEYQKRYGDDDDEDEK